MQCGKLRFPQSVLLGSYDEPKDPTKSANSFSRVSSESVLERCPMNIASGSAFSMCALSKSLKGWLTSDLKPCLVFPEYSRCAVQKFAKKNVKQFSNFVGFEWLQGGNSLRDVRSDHFFGMPGAHQSPRLPKVQPFKPPGAKAPNHSEVVKFLVEQGARISAKDDTGETSLMKAWRWAMPSIQNTISSHKQWSQTLHSPP